MKKIAAILWLLLAAALVSGDEYTVSAGGSFGTQPIPIFGGVRGSGSLWQVRAERSHPLGCSRVSAVLGAVPLEAESGTYGFGLDPVGLDVPIAGPVSLGLRGGLRWFAHAVPIPEAQRFNFTFDVLVSARLRSLTIGADFHHISNGGLADRNPGANYVIFMVGWHVRH